MLVVFKYKIQINDYFELELPKGAQILDVAEQHGFIYAWALVDPDSKPETRLFRFAGTGHSIHEDNLMHIKTFQIDNGNLIFHIFEII